MGSQSPLIIVPKMTGSIIGIYNGRTFNEVEIKPEMITHDLAELSISHMEDLVLVRHSANFTHGGHLIGEIGLKRTSGSVLQGEAMAIKEALKPAQTFFSSTSACKIGFRPC